MRLLLFVSILFVTIIVSCKTVDKEDKSERSAEDDPSQVTMDSVLPDPEPIILEFKRRYSVSLPEEYMRWPDPGEDNDYPSIFSVSEDSLSVHTPIYGLSAPNYFTYQRGDSLVFGSARLAHEIDDYWYHLAVDEHLLKSNTGSGRQFKKGEAYFFKFPSNQKSFCHWVLFDFKDEAIELYKFNVFDSVSNLTKRFDCFSKNLRDMAVINECRFRVVYNSVLYYNTINNGFFYIDLNKGRSKCGVIPEFSDYLVGLTEGDSLVVSNFQKDTAWILDQDGRKAKTFKWTLANSIHDELLLDPRRRKILLSKYDWDTFRFDIYEANF